MDTHNAEQDDSADAEPTTELPGFDWSAEPTAAPRPEPEPEPERQQGREQRRRPNRRALTAGVAVVLIGSGVVVVGWHESSQSSTGANGMPLSATVETVSITATPPGSNTPSAANNRTSAASHGSTPSATASHSAQASPTVVGTDPTPANSSSAGANDDPTTSSAAVAPANTDTPPSGYGTADLALNRAATATSYTQTYVPSNITDGDVESYWEGSRDAFPQTVTVDLGSVQWVAELQLSLPPDSDWNSRTQTIAVYGAQSGTSPSETLAAATGYTFNADNGTGDAVTITFAPQQTRYLILRFSANSGWYAAQLSELSAYS